MKLITRFELTMRSKSELHALYCEVFGALARSAPGSAERRNSLASLENIQAEIRVRDLEPLRYLRRPAGLTPGAVGMNRPGGMLGLCGCREAHHAMSAVLG